MQKSDNYISVILSTGYLLINLLLPSQLNGMKTQVTKTVLEANPKYNIIFKILYLQYDVKLVTFVIDDIMSDRDIPCPCHGLKYIC